MVLGSIVLGTVSGNLVARDFDIPNSFDRWADANSRLAEILPIVQAGRGPHVYARIFDCPAVKLTDGEVRSGGQYVIAPPSIHSSGCQYRWTRGFDSLADVPMLTLAESDFAVDWRTSKSSKLQIDTELVSVRSVVICPHLSLSVPICNLIEGTLPPCNGTRRHRLFMLARAIRTNADLKDIPIPKLKPIVQEWHRLALPMIRTKDFDESWIDFIEAYKRVDLSRCWDSAEAAMKRADTKELPPEAVQYDSEFVRRLVGLCSELSRSSIDGTFYLACRKAAEVLGNENHAFAAKTLRMLCADGVLLETDRGGPHNNRASRYRYLRG